MNALILVTGDRWWCWGSSSRRRSRGARLREVRRRGPASSTSPADLTRIMLPFLTTLAVAAAMMGMLNSLRRFFVPSLSPAMFNVASIFSALRARAADAALRPRADRRHGDRHAARRPRPDPAPVADAAAGGFPLPADRQLQGSGRARDPAPDGAGDASASPPSRSTCSSTPISPPARSRGRCRGSSIAFRLMYLPIGIFGVSIATASLPDISRQAAANDLPAVRAIGLARPADDADAERAGDGRADGAGRTDRRHDLRARRLQRLATPWHRGRADVLRAGLLGYSAVKIASPTFYSLRDSRTPGHRQRAVGRGEPRR